MKKTVLGIMVTVCVMAAGTYVSYASAHQGRMYKDTNNDGICDYYGTSNGCGGYGKNCQYNQNSQCGMYVNDCEFIDENNDGICDNYQNNAGTRRGMGMHMCRNRQ